MSIITNESNAYDLVDNTFASGSTYTANTFFLEVV